jgi:hypothetical protein
VSPTSVFEHNLSVIFFDDNKSISLEMWVPKSCTKTNEKFRRFIIYKSSVILPLYWFDEALIIAYFCFSFFNGIFSIIDYYVGEISTKNGHASTPIK